MTRRIFIGLFVLLILGISIWLLYRSGFREGQVSLEIEAPEEAIAGEEIEYKVIVENKNNFDLGGINLSFFYPEGSIPLSQEERPASSLTSKLDLSELESRSKKEFVLKGIIAGEKNEVKKARASLTYRPSNITTTFEKNAEVATTISSAPVFLNLSAPPNVLPGQLVQVSLDFRNESNKDLNDLQIVFSYPDGFSLKKSVPLADQNNNIFNLDSLKADEAGRITLEGNISGFEKEAKRFTAALKKKIGNQFFEIQKTQISLTISTPLLTTDVLANDSKNYIAEAGDKIRYTIKFSNNSNYNFSALELRAKLEGQMFDFSTLKSSGFFDQNSRTILWNAAAEPLLSNLAPNQGGEVSFDIELKDDFPKSFSKDYSLRVSSSIETSSVPPDFGLEKISASADLISKIKAKAEFTSEAFFNDSIFPNSGPVPPRVGQKTTYTIHWKIIGEGNDLTNVRIISALLPGLNWEDKVKVTPSQSDLDYNPSTGRISWNLSTVPAGTGVISTVFEAVFQIGITPSVNQTGQSPEIIKEINFEAVDNWTKQNIEINLPGINTSAIKDSPGTVQP